LCTLLCAPRAYASGAAVVADFDGDGHRDRVSLDAHEPFIVRIWLSATKSIHIIRSSQPLRAVTAVDLNGDRRSELIATTRSSGLHVWTKARAGFRAYHRKRPASRDFTRPDRRTVDDDGDDAALAIDAARPAPPSTAITNHRRGPPPAVHADVREQTHAVRASVALARFSPRPPPLS
jgi:hypothetical protein